VARLSVGGCLVSSVFSGQLVRALDTVIIYSIFVEGVNGRMRVNSGGYCKPPFVWRMLLSKSLKIIRGSYGR
jgi:hypothetical protein